jgi:Flp pilus assembly secretin CpaC
MPSWKSRANVLVALTMATLTASCMTRRSTTLSPEDLEKLNHNQGAAQQAETDRQKVTPDQEADMRRSHGPSQLKAAEPIWVQSGKSRVVQLPAAVKRVSIGDPELAGVVVLGPRTVMINAKKVPHTARQTSTGAGATSTGQPLLIGRTITPEPAYAETTFAVWYGAETNPDVHTLFVADFLDQQVMLDVTVAEINRTAIEQHGIDFRAAKNSFLAAYFMGGGAGPAPSGSSSLVPPGILPIGTTSDTPIFAFTLPNDDITGFIEAMQQDGLARVLAQPKLVALSGQNAVFQVGGEIPILIATGFATAVEFKPFGTIVNFVARVSEEGDITLTVSPEVSQPNFGSLVEGIPSFQTRRASTSARLRNGQTMVIGGLMQNQMTEAITGIPYLKDIPIIGYVFRKSNYSDNVTEIMVVVTPYIVQPLPAGTEVALPTDRGPLINAEIRDQPHPAEATRPRVPGLP